MSCICILLCTESIFINTGFFPTSFPKIIGMFNTGSFTLSFDDAKKYFGVILFLRLSHTFSFNTKLHISVICVIFPVFQRHNIKFHSDVIVCRFH